MELNFLHVHRQPPVIRYDIDSNASYSITTRQQQQKIPGKITSKENTKSIWRKLHNVKG